MMFSNLMTGAGFAEMGRMETLLASMTLEVETAQLHAYEKFSAGGVERLGIPPIVMSDGSHGVLGDMIANTWNSADRQQQVWQGLSDAGASPAQGPASSAKRSWSPNVERCLSKTRLS